MRVRGELSCKQRISEREGCRSAGGASRARERSEHSALGTEPARRSCNCLQPSPGLGDWSPRFLAPSVHGVASLLVRVCAAWCCGPVCPVCRPLWCCGCELSNVLRVATVPVPRQEPPVTFGLSERARHASNNQQERGGRGRHNTITNTALDSALCARPAALLCPCPFRSPATPPSRCVPSWPQSFCCWPWPAARCCHSNLPRHRRPPPRMSPWFREAHTGARPPAAP